MAFLTNAFGAFWECFKWIFFPSTSNPMFYAFGVFVFAVLTIRLLFGILRGGNFD